MWVVVWVNAVENEGLHCNDNCKEFNHMQLIDLFSIMLRLSCLLLSEFLVLISLVHLTLLQGGKEGLANI